MFQLNENDQELLLRIARDAVRTYLSGESFNLPEIVSGVLAEPRPVFVSIHKGDELRGCIGNVHPTGPLYRSAAECAVSAAVGDPRFMPLNNSEFTDVVFEISVLSPMERVDKIEEIEIGTHGLMITKGNARGLLLPQVASSYGWTREHFLSETCRKAGLSSDEWRNGAIILRFSALVFGERRLHIASPS
jgi:AmmeMemoRadiSam system protein A